jgi:GntR family transcriptional repressor for pyruvate dehydrogenase complex
VTERLFPHVSRAKLAATVAQQIRDTVRELEPGTRLPSLATLPQQLGVGRSTVREAMTGLEAMGIIEVRHGQGIFVSNGAPTVPLADDLSEQSVEARTLVEIQLAELAARRRTQDELDAMAATLDRHAEHLAAGEGPIMATSQFHMLLIDAAHNDVLAAVVRPFLKVAFERGPALYQTDSEYADRELAEHRDIYEAIRAGDAGEARRRMQAHLDTMNVYYRESEATS